ncbi:MAG: sugar phosphate isomerase/epimerase [Verrucomicrobia bacterium]|nr:sugar phosphate isomerase/epimerase [Verrucomicrobiota bacterium]
MKTSRRTFLQRSTLASAVLATGASLPTSLSAGDAFIRPGNPRLRLGLAGYSFRKYFLWSKGKPQKPEDPSRSMDMFKFIDFCADHNCQGAELTAYFIPPDAGKDYYNRLKYHAFVRGLSISGTAIGNDFSLPKGPKLDYQIEGAKHGLDQAAAMGAPHVRFFAGTGNGFAQGRDRVKNAIESLKICCDYAGEKGIFIGVENHGNITPELLLEIIGKVDSPWIGINLDTGNFISDTPYEDLEQCALHTVNVQVKVKMKAPDGKKYPADLDRIADILKRANYQGFVVLEFEENNPFKEVPTWLNKLDTALNS